MKKNDDHPDGFDFDTVCREYTEEVSYEYDPNLDLQQEEQGVDDEDCDLNEHAEVDEDEGEGSESDDQNARPRKVCGGWRRSPRGGRR